MRELTPKQEKFCQVYITTSNATEAYRQAYNVSNMKPESINRVAKELIDTIKVSSRIKELKSELLIDFKYTLEKSVKRDIKLIEMYEKALNIMDNELSSDEAVVRASLMIRGIGVTGYSSAQDRLSKQHGFYEQDNKQKAPPAFIMFDARRENIINDEDDEGEVSE